jgi:hypothetical protein
MEDGVRKNKLPREVGELIRINNVVDHFPKLLSDIELLIPKPFQ